MPRTRDMPGTPGSITRSVHYLIEQSEDHPCRRCGRPHMSRPVDSPHCFCMGQTDAGAAQTKRELDAARLAIKLERQRTGRTRET